MKYFSMFTGVGGFELGIGNKAECIGFSEIDKYCSQLLEHKFLGIRNYGDCTKIQPELLPDFNLLCGGFPCQSFSIAGKRRGFEDTRGTMFFEIARILKVKRPMFILLENVKGLLNHNKGETFKVIMETLEELGYDVQWMVLNSKFHGVPQNRERVFIIGSLRGEPKPEILPFRTINQEIIGEENIKEESDTIVSTYWKGGKGTHIQPTTLLDNNQAQRVYSSDGVSITIKGGGGGQGAKTGLYAIPFALRSYPRNQSRIDNPEQERYQNMEFRKDECTNTLSSVEKDNLLKISNQIRRLTPIECERLQGFPDNWTEGFSDTQRYKMMGNAVTVNVIKVITDKLLK